MRISVSVSVNLLLTSGGEQIRVTGSGERITIRFQSARSGLNHIRGFLQRPELVERLDQFDSGLRALGISLYASIRGVVFPILGVRSGSVIKNIMVFLAFFETRNKRLSKRWQR